MSDVRREKQEADMSGRRSGRSGRAGRAARRRGGVQTGQAYSAFLAAMGLEMRKRGLVGSLPATHRLERVWERRGLDMTWLRRFSETMDRHGGGG